MNLKHNLGDTVKNKLTEEAGEVIGRAEYSASEGNYFVRYKAADGRAVKDWWTESDVEAPVTA